MNDDDNDGQMMFGDLVGLKLPDICLTGEGKTPKNLTQETCPGRGSNPDPLRDRHACYRLAHRGGRCASEKRNVEEVRQKIKISNHSATRLARNLAEIKRTQSQSLFTIRCYGDHAELPEKPIRGVIILLWHARLSPRNHPQLSKVPALPPPQPFHLAT